MIRIRVTAALAVVFSISFAFNFSSAQSSSNAISLFDGESFSGWQGDTENTWRVENGVVIAGSMERPAARNEFLCTKAKYSDFELTLEFRIDGTEKLNAGIQFRTEPVHGYHEVSGYQADIGTGYHGCLYDESRRRRVLARPDDSTDKKVASAVAKDGWQSYRIRAVGNRIQLWLNGIQTVDYTETDESIAAEGIIALQIHGNMVGTIAYRSIMLQDLSSDSLAPAIEDFSWISGHWTGKALGGEFEETWNPSLGGEMMGMFKLVKDEKVQFYELLTIVPQDDSYVLRLKHFNEGLIGWEEKDKSVEFPLILASPTKIVFKGLEFSRATKFTRDRMKIEVAVQGQGEPLVFECSRSK